MSENKLKMIASVKSGNFSSPPLYIIVLLSIAIVFGFYLYHFNDHVSQNSADWGDFGSYFGGVLGPVVSFVTFYLITKSYEEQRKQTKLAALIALVNINLERISFLQAEYNRIIEELCSSIEDKKIVQRLLYLESHSGLGNCSPDDPDLRQRLEEERSRDAEYSSLREELEEMGPEYSAMYYRLNYIQGDISSYEEDNNKLKSNIIKYLGFS